ncbi:17581_t:CDS:2 [Dentiscutata erythropus]|uniref:17581_t:CDS:1 n=1 Tax=Dentiscutata erythropus TaxID=1348616 RepID=A0A9N9E1V3_9GLOM|nr:17581_t:CDS:2 [Dentiscutata erythropus]
MEIEIFITAELARKQDAHSLRRRTFEIDIQNIYDFKNLKESKQH